jgi:hypothetical protein
METLIIVLVAAAALSGRVNALSHLDHPVPEIEVQCPEEIKFGDTIVKDLRVYHYELLPLSLEERRSLPLAPENTFNLQVCCKATDEAGKPYNHVVTKRIRTMERPQYLNRVFSRTRGNGH